LKDLLGKKYNRLTIIGEAPMKVFPSGRKRQVKAQCDCGNIKDYVLAALKSGKTKSCGCYNLDKITIHGMNDTRQYQIWADMKTRCDNIKHKWYPEYGGRGISYDKSWAKFENFWNDMKDDYSEDLTLDRIDNNAGYSKENCRWAPSSLQSHNQRKARTSLNTYLGVTYDSDRGTNISARIKRDGETIYLGSYKSEEEAAKAYDDASEIIYGDRPNGTIRSEDQISKQVNERSEEHTSELPSPHQQ
jgi:hypothetical protein